VASWSPQSIPESGGSAEITLQATCRDRPTRPGCRIASGGAGKWESRSHDGVSTIEQRVLTSKRPLPLENRRVLRRQLPARCAIINRRAISPAEGQTSCRIRLSTITNS
jgi:hypothetical protein